MTRRSHVAMLAAFIAMTGCTPTHERDPSEIVDPCLSLDSDSLACAMVWAAAIDGDRCRFERECGHRIISDEACALAFPPEGAGQVSNVEDNIIALAEGRVRFDARGPRCRLEHLRRCEEAPVGDEPPCPPTWVATATLEEGAVCASPFECGPGMTCAGYGSRCGVGRGTCVRLAGAGEACAPPGTGLGPICDDALGLTCVDGACARLDGYDRGASEGEPCGRATRDADGRVLFRACGDELGCAGEPGAETCAPPAPCGDVGVCGPWTFCRSGACVPVSMHVGDPCTSVSQGLCVLGIFSLVCDGDIGQCVETHRRLGEECAWGWVPCIEGVCTLDHQDEGHGAVFRCALPREAGAPCARDLECASHACCGDVCGG